MTDVEKKIASEIKNACRLGYELNPDYECFYNMLAPSDRVIEGLVKRIIEIIKTEE